MIACVHYTQTVVAHVNTETGEVERVVRDEDVALAVPAEVRERDSWAPVDSDVAERAVEIAEDTDWPAWDQG